MAHEIICYRLTHAFCQNFPTRLSLIYAHITNLMHIPKKKQQINKAKTLLYSTPYILIYYYFEPIPTLRPMNDLQLGFDQLTKTARDRWQINYYLKL